MRLSHNIASLNIFASYSKALQKQSDALNQISSGSRINSAKDDPNGIAQSEKMRMQIRGLQMAGTNAQDGVSMLQTADGGLDGMSSMLQRMRELVVQAGNGTNKQEDKNTIQNEIDQMVDGMDNMAKSTDFNGVKLLCPGPDAPTDSTGKPLPLKMAIGANAGESVEIPQQDLTSSNLQTADGKNLAQMKSGGPYSISNGNNTDNALDIIDNALDIIDAQRSKYGALENRFEGSIDNISEISIKIQGADSSLTDTDMAEAMEEYAKDNILAEAGNAMMVQTNKFPQDALQILQNVRSN